MIDEEKQLPYRELAATMTPKRMTSVREGPAQHIPARVSRMNKLELRKEMTSLSISPKNTRNGSISFGKRLQRRRCLNTNLGIMGSNSNQGRNQHLDPYMLYQKKNSLYYAGTSTRT